MTPAPRSAQPQHSAGPCLVPEPPPTAPVAVARPPTAGSAAAPPPGRSGSDQPTVASPQASVPPCRHPLPFSPLVEGRTGIGLESGPASIRNFQPPATPPLLQPPHNPPI